MSQKMPWLVFAGVAVVLAGAAAFQFVGGKNGGGETALNVAPESGVGAVAKSGEAPRRVVLKAQSSKQQEPAAAVPNVAPLNAVEQSVAGLFAAKDLSKMPSGELLEKLKQQGFEFNETKSGGDATGTRSSYVSVTPHSGFASVQVQYARGAEKEVLEGFRFTAENTKFASFVQEMIKDEVGLKVLEKSDTRASFLRPDGYVVWFAAFDEKNPPDVAAGASPNIMRGGVEPSVD